MKKAVIYARVSTNRQAEEGMSIDAQLKQLRDYASKEGYEIIREYVDRGESAKTADRPQFQQMISDIKSSPEDYNAVLIHKTDRFARNREDSIVYKSLLRRDCDCDVIAINENFGDGPIGKMVEGILEVIAEFYSENLSKEVLKGMREKAQSGKLLGKVAYGYYNENGNIKIHEKESKVIQWIFDRYTKDGWGTQKIGYELRHNGPNIFEFNTNIKSNGDEMAWRERTIRRILRNDFYIGTYSWNDTTIPSNHPALITKKQFRKADNMLSKRANSESNIGKWGKWLWSGIFRCYECGAAMKRRIAARKTVEDRVYLSCVNYAKYNECYRNSHRLDRIKPIIIETLRDIEKGKVDPEELNFKQKNTDYQAKKKRLQEKLDNIGDKFERQMQAFEAGVINLEQLQEHQERLQEEEKQLKQKIKQLDKKSKQKVSDKDKFRSKLSTLADLLEDDNADFSDKRALLLETISEIRLSEKQGNIDIYFRS